jgi:hypothetical protein
MTRDVSVDKIEPGKIRLGLASADDRRPPSPRVFSGLNHPLSLL